MADETPMSPISAAEPPKVDPLAKPASAHTATLKLNPVVRKPAVGGATQTGLKPGLKLPPKTGLATAGLKLPPKPGATLGGLKPGVRLPPKTGLATAGLKLPTQKGLRPTIHAPGAAAKPVVPGIAKPAAPATAAATPAATPAAPSAATPAAAPASAATPATPATPAAAAPKPLEALKTVTQNLKSITAPIPQQAILHKTGIIADPGLTEAEKQATKTKTARISLSDAMGAAPVSNDAPMKTIRIKRPVDLGTSPTKHALRPASTLKPAAAAPAATKPAATPAPAAPAADAAKPGEPSPSITQRKTLKISRPGVVRPTGNKFGIKKPAPPASAEKPAEGGADEVADIPDLAPVPPAPVAAAKDGEKAITGPFAIVTLIGQIAACGAMGFLGWLLYQNFEMLTLLLTT